MENLAESGSTGQSGTHSQGRLSRLLVKCGDRAIFVAAEDIRWIQADDDHLRLHAGIRFHRVRSTLAGLHARLDPRQFLRIHRSALVNVAFISEIRIQPSGDGEVLLQDGTALRLSRTYRGALQELGGVFKAGERQA